MSRMENLNQLSCAMRQLCYQELPAAYFPWVLMPFISLSCSVFDLSICSPTLSLWLQSQRICPFITEQPVHHFKWHSAWRRQTYFYTTWRLSLRGWQAKQIQSFLFSNPKSLKWNSQTIASQSLRWVQLYLNTHLCVCWTRPLFKWDQTTGAMEIWKYGNMKPT